MTREEDVTMTSEEWAELDERTRQWELRERGYLTWGEAGLELAKALVIGLGVGWVVSQVMLRAHGL